MTTRLLIFVVLILPACGELRAPGPPRGGEVRFTYKRDVAPLLEARCVSCHGPQKREGRYDVSSWEGLIRPGTDETPNVLAGQESSLLLTRLAASDPVHGAMVQDGERAMLRTWIVEDQLAYFDVNVHPPSWLNPQQLRDKESFHGGYLRKRDWNFDGCRGCHGQDLNGGTAGRSCLSCHTAGVEGCSTCHGDDRRPGDNSGAPPVDLASSYGREARGVGAHLSHLERSAVWAGTKCESCHRVPAALRAVGHVDDDDLRAEVDFQGLAAQGATGGYNRDDLTCSGVYCHGAPLNDPLAKRVNPKWNERVSLGCDSCHGNPGKGLGGPECQLCHQQSVAGCTPGEPDCLATGKRALDGKEVGVRFLDPALHVDGKFPLGRKDATTACDGCHGTGALGTPPPDVHGQAASPAVGLHEVHLKGGSLSTGVACEECHRVPNNVLDEGHVDSDLPAELVFGPMSKGQTAYPTVDMKPTYEPATRTCQSSYCHNLDGAVQTTWSWTQPISPTCTSCHGLPPAKLAKGGDHPLSPDCTTCHSTAYKNGLPDPAKHMNGRVDL